MRVHAEPRYLLSDALDRIARFSLHHPVYASLILLALYGSALGVLRWWFEEDEFQHESYLFALVISAILLLVGSALYTYLKVPGFHFGG
jgi:hypothetical protein